MNKEKIIEVIKQVIHNPQVLPPPITYTITQNRILDDENYTADYIDKGDFDSFMKRFEKQLIYRINNLK